MNRIVLSVGMLLLAGCNAAQPSASGNRASPTATAPKAASAPSHRPGASGLRPRYQQCVDAAAGVVPDTQACIGEEFAYQDERLKAALDRKLREADPAGTAAAQVAWRNATDTRCSWNAADEGQGQRLEANACELEAMAARADELSR